MSEDTNAHESGDNTTNENESGSSNALLEMKEQLDQMRLQNAQLMGKIEAIASQKTTDTKPQLTAEQYSKMLQENPQEAIGLAVKRVIESEVKPLLGSLEVKSAKEKWDTKAEKEFPLNDKEFQGLLKNEIAELINTDGLSKDHPTLIYRAAQLASAKYSKKTNTGSKGGMSGEAPTNISRDNKKYYQPSANQDALFKVFGISTKESQEKFLKRAEEKAKLEAHREARRSR